MVNKYFLSLNEQRACLIGRYQELGAKIITAREKMLSAKKDMERYAEERNELANQIDNIEAKIKQVRQEG